LFPNVESYQEIVRMKIRIVKRTSPGGKMCYVIQQQRKFFFFFKFWEDATYRIPFGGVHTASFTSLEKADRHLCFYDGTPTVDCVVFEK